MTLALGEKQEVFSYLLAQLIIFAYGRGLKIRMGEVLRMQAQADANAASGAGISNSLHLLKLAVDINLFRDGEYLLDIEDYRPLGDFWKGLAEGCRWGGDFKDSQGRLKPDSVHFSIEHNGVK
jgi:hypothetical protein